MKSILFAVDVGSFSICCTVYEYQGIIPYCRSPVAVHQTGDESSVPSPPIVSPIEGISHTIAMAAIVPNTGHIRIHKVLMAIDECIDEVLRLLRQGMRDSSYQIVGIGCSTSVMNLVGVDIYGQPVGDVATCSYACNREDVVKECQSLRDNLGPEKLQTIHQRTGAPVHVSYALPQLRAFYGNKSTQGIAKRIDKWQTISSICLQRWSGAFHLQMPISYSEASWTGMLNFQSCHWDDEVLELVETCDGVVQYSFAEEEDDKSFDCGIDLLPPLVHLDAALPRLRGGIPQFNDDGSINCYWERWPDLRSRTVAFAYSLSGLVRSRHGVEIRNIKS